jgi:hypothetical protein
VTVRDTVLLTSAEMTVPMALDHDALRRERTATITAMAVHTTPR